MEPILNFAQLTAHLKKLNHRKRISVVCANDPNTEYAMRKGKLVLRGIVNHTQRNDTAPYLTGGVYTKGKKAFTNGRIEICAKLNAAGGAWPAIWMLPEGAAWPSGGEIDIMERLNNDSIAYQTVHSLSLIHI